MGYLLSAYRDGSGKTFVTPDCNGYFALFCLLYLGSYAYNLYLLIVLLYLRAYIL